VLFGIANNLTFITDLLFKIFRIIIKSMKIDQGLQVMYPGPAGNEPRACRYCTQGVLVMYPGRVGNVPRACM
jgi:hypothetical protein